MSERWLPILGCSGCHEVSDAGRVRSLDRVVQRVNGSTLRCPGQMLNPTVRSDGYRVVRLHGKTVYVCRLVLTAFVGECPPRMEACHGSGGSADDSLDNLRWDSRHANIMDAVHGGTHYQASKNCCRYGHEYTEANTYRMPGGHRDCRKCRARRMRDFRERRVAN